MPCVQLRFDAFFGGGFSFEGAQALLPPATPCHGRIPKTISPSRTYEIDGETRSGAFFAVHAVAPTKMLALGGCGLAPPGAEDVGLKTLAHTFRRP